MDGSIPDVSVDGPFGAVGVLGSPCAQPGQLGCAGTHQKLTLVCGGDKLWAKNQTCGVKQFCESSTGPNTGLCLNEVAACATHAGGATVCADNKLVQCSADGTSTTVLADCVGVCEAGACVDVADPCLPSSLGDCGGDCGNLVNPQCALCSVGPLYTGMFRLPSTDKACSAGCASNRRTFKVTLSIVTPERVRVPAPWYIIHATDDVCTTVGASCVNVTTAGSAYALVLVTDDPSALPRNLFIDFGPCP